MPGHKTRKIRHIYNAASLDSGIPKIIHQIWIGKNVIPQDWVDTVSEFAKTYGYEYKLWTESNVPSLMWDSFKDLENVYKKMESKKAYAGCSDIIRLLALYEFGGIYIDADSVIMKAKKFNDFLENNKADVFFGWRNQIEPKIKAILEKDKSPEIRNTKRLVANGLIGSVKDHPFIKILIEGIVKSVENGKDVHAWQSVGPLYVSREYFAHKNEFPKIKVYPMKYFYPILWKNIEDPFLHKKIKIPSVSMLFQYGYSTNHFQMYFNNCNRTKKNKRI